MSAEPVAWMTDKEPFRVVLAETKACMPSVAAESHCIPLYSESPAQARAMAIAECARVGRDLYKGDGSRLNSYDEGWNDGIDAAEQAIRALSEKPSVTEEWVVERARTAVAGIDTADDDVYIAVRSAVRATLAALGIEVTK